ncbi:MAG: beta-lactamase family protein [Hyphomonadaceae bacterium]|nr:beta-lactamase family protein [Hyphomonadaceae bacterium]
MDRRTFMAGAGALAVAPFTLASGAFAANYEAAARYSAERRGVSLIVVRRGAAVFEDYPNGGGAERGWNLASGTKSFTGIMAAAGVKDGLLTLDERASRTLSEWQGDERREITIRHLLSLTSGLQPGAIGRPPTYAEAVATPLAWAPGSRFSYGPTSFQAFGELMRRKLGGDPLEWLQRRVLDSINVRFESWRRGSDGNPLMPQGCVMRARQWAEFGQFVLAEARQGARGLLDRDALRECFRASEANPGYGLSWWLLRPGLIPPAGGMRVEIDGAAIARLGDVRMAAGAGDQRLYLMPERELVVARQAHLLGMRFGPRWSDAEFLRLLLG